MLTAQKDYCLFPDRLSFICKNWGSIFLFRSRCGCGIGWVAVLRVILIAIADFILLSAAFTFYVFLIRATITFRKLIMLTW